jgi:hypothetical protein
LADDTVIELSDDVELLVSAALPLNISIENSTPAISNNPINPAMSLVVLFFFCSCVCIDFSIFALLFFIFPLLAQLSFAEFRK